MRTSESTVNLLKNEATFAEAAPKFSSSIDEALAKPGITAAERTQLETLRTTATQLEPSTYSALSAADRAKVLTDAESQVANLERQSGEAARLRESFNEVKTSARDLEQARTASSAEESSVTTLRTSSTADPSCHKEHLNLPSLLRLRLNRNQQMFLKYATIGTSSCCSRESWRHD